MQELRTSLSHCLMEDRKTPEVSSNLEKFVWKIPLKLSHKTETKCHEIGNLEMRNNAKKLLTCF